MFLSRCIFSCLVLAAIANCAPKAGVTVETKNGVVSGGTAVTIEGQQNYFFFRGIPYAEPPVGNLRFEPPVAKSNWQGVLDATQDASACIQNSEPVVGSEDCLYINVYTPQQPSASCGALPVMAWIYGGGFEGGDASYDLYGPDHLLDQGIVVVTFNYRLGFLGFMTTGDLVVPGNNGLKDQLLALKWVKDNIRNFCGDPDQVTLAGQSAGSASVAYHVQSKKSEGLFHRAILQSGTSLSLWAYSRRAVDMVQAIATSVGIDNSTSQSIVDGLRELNATYLQTSASSTMTSSYLSNNPRMGFAMAPVSEPAHDGAFFTGKQHDLLKNGDFNKVPILIGFNSLEGTYNFELLFRLYLVKYDLNQEQLLPAMNVASNLESTAARELKNSYFGWVPVSLSDRNLMEFLSDDQFVRSIREFARLVHNQGLDVYLYRFSYEGGLWGNHNRTTSGVTHSEELGYYWVSKHDPQTPHDLVVKERMVTLWSNFVKQGNPTPTKLKALGETIWKPLGNELNYLDIGEHLVATQEPEKDRMDFWDSFYDKYGNPPYDSY